MSPWLHPGLFPFLPLCADAAHASLLPVHSCLLQPPLQASGFSHLSAPISASMLPLALCLPLSLFFSGLCHPPTPPASLPRKAALLPRKAASLGWLPAVTSPSGPRLGRGAQGQHQGHEPAGLGVAGGGMGRGALPSQPHRPLSFPQPQRSFLPFFRLLLPLLFILPKYAQAVIMGPESSHTQPAPASLPPSWPHGPPHRAPCRPRLMGARWPPSDSATGLWEPRRPAFPCPHTRLLLP